MRKWHGPQWREEDARGTNQQPEAAYSFPNIPVIIVCSLVHLTFQRGHSKQTKSLHPSAEVRSSRCARTDQVSFVVQEFSL